MLLQLPVWLVQCAELALDLLQECQEESHHQPVSQWAAHHQDLLQEDQERHPQVSSPHQASKVDLQVKVVDSQVLQDSVEGKGEMYIWLGSGN